MSVDEVLSSRPNAKRASIEERRGSPYDYSQYILKERIVADGYYFDVAYLFKDSSLVEVSLKHRSGGGSIALERSLTILYGRPLIEKDENIEGIQCLHSTRIWASEQHNNSINLFTQSCKRDSNFNISLIYRPLPSREATGL